MYRISMYWIRAANDMHAQWIDKKKGAICIYMYNLQERSNKKNPWTMNWYNQWKMTNECHPICTALSIDKFYHRKYMLKKKNHIHCILLLHDHFRWNFSPWDIHSRDYQVKVTKLINRSQLWEYWEVSRARPQGPCGGWGVISHSIVSRRMQRQTLLLTDC